MPTNASHSYPITPDPNGITVNVANIRFTGPHTNYNPLYDRENQLNINPPQWRLIPSRNEPISYVKRKSATIQLDITGSPKIPTGTPIRVRVKPSAELLKKTLTKKGQEILVPDPGSSPITFMPQSKEIRVKDWGDPDYDQLTFRTSALPNEVRLNQLNITWDFKYRHSPTGPWYDAGKETTEHEIYITYHPSYKGFRPSRRPWKEVLKTACSYTHGANSVIEVSKRVTTNIYDSLDFSYDETMSHSNFHNSQILLWRMLKEGWVDCMDGSNYYTILMRWLGINANQIKITEGPGGFHYKLLRPISTTRFDPAIKKGWFEGHWNFHQVGIFKDHIYDPIIMIDKIRNPRIPIEMRQPDYKRAIFHSGIFKWNTKALVARVY